MVANWHIEEFGAVPDGTTLNTAAIQRAIDACHEAGGGTVHCGPGCFLTGSIELKSNVTLDVGPGCRLLGSPSLADYDEFVAAGFHNEFSPERCSQHLIRAVRAENVGIVGPGVVDGNGLAFYDTATAGARFFAKPPTPRPRLVMFYECRNVRFEDTSYVDSPCWTFWLMKCSRVSIHRLRVHGDQRMINNDGIDIDACRDVTVSDCILKTADDCLILRSIRRVYDTPGVCENVTVSNCVLDSWCQGVRVGCPGDGTIRNCTFTNLTITSKANGIIVENPKRYLREGTEGTADVHDILFSHVAIDCAREPIRVFVEEGIRLVGLQRLTFSDLRVRSGGVCRIEGSSQTPVRDVRLSNVSIETRAEQAVVCRNCIGLKMDGVEFGNWIPVGTDG